MRIGRWLGLCIELERALAIAEARQQLRVGLGAERGAEWRQLVEARQPEIVEELARRAVQRRAARRLARADRLDPAGVLGLLADGPAGRDTEQVFDSATCD